MARKSFSDSLFGVSVVQLPHRSRLMSVCLSVSVASCTRNRVTDAEKFRSFAPSLAKKMGAKKMDVIKREEAKRVASGGGHFRPTSDELGLRVCTK